jgi:outer membrane protein insertion porin family
VDKGSSAFTTFFLEGNNVLDRKLRGKFKSPSERKSQILTAGKSKRSEYEDDKKALVEFFYNAEGYRDAIVVSDTLVR